MLKEYFPWNLQYMRCDHKVSRLNLQISFNLIDWGHCWRSRGELISDVLLWTPFTWPSKGRTTSSNRHTAALCRYRIRVRWQERVRDIHTDGATWWYWTCLRLFYASSSSADGFSWLFFSVCPYHPLLLAGVLNYILCPHTADTKISPCWSSMCRDPWKNLIYEFSPSPAVSCMSCKSYLIGFWDGR